jgi:UDP-N-acetylglucosamine--N-acetylmuramyl-(pentapeptide) pyrophosphoryl-undecaprenol N-acetylglucosamine transferase
MITKAVFAAGGTGGHIFPAIAVADELKKLNPEIKIIFFGAKGRIEEKIVPDNGYELKTIEVKGFSRSISPKNIGVIIKYLKAVNEAKKYMMEFKPELVYGTGGFVSGPVLTAASKLGIPTAVQEGNYYPGIAVKWLSKKVDNVILNFAESKKFLKRHDNIEIMQYPVRSNLKRYSKKEASLFFGLDENKKTLFVFGGSQGARSLNSALSKAVDEINKNNIQLIWQTGAREFEKIKNLVNSFNNIKVFQFIEKIDYAFSASDLIVCRSGISTIMELAGFGAPVVFVPFPLATENHQEKNARALVDAAAAEMIPDREIEYKFSSVIFSLLNDEAKLKEMSEKIRKFADKDAALKTAELLFRLAETRIN